MIPLLFAIHSHQPVGNFGWVFEKAVNDSYQPFLELLSEHPRIKVAIHYSGCLLEWIETHAPSHLDLLKKLVELGQVEILGGGYYEPILPIIPERDAKAQVLSYSRRLESLFGRRPKGLWLTERVWDPRLPELLADVGVEFTLVDDSHFRFAGIGRDEIWGPYIAESLGKKIVIFPIDKTLRYYIPFREPEESIRHIRERAQRAPGFVACYGDDGEKFGVWPGTKEWVFTKGWLSRFFRTLEQVEDEIRTVHFSDYLATAALRGRVYLPPASYDEMMEWALPPRLGMRLEDFKHQLQDQGKWDDLSPFVRGGHWEMFLAKYDESNRMHKRMLLASDRVAQNPKAPPEAQTMLMRGQCNCAYWHGVFGGLYLNYLRHAVYEQLIGAENLALADQALKLERQDYDFDGAEEVIVSSPEINAIVSPRQGGGLVALEYPRKRFAVSNLMSRREESYHRKLFSLAERTRGGSPATIHDEMQAKEEGLEKRLFRDRFPRNSFQEHLAPLGLNLDDLEAERVPYLAALAGAEYKITQLGPHSVSLLRETAAADTAIRLAKTFHFANRRPGLKVAYDLTNSGPAPINALFMVELNLTLLAGDDPGRYYRINGDRPTPSNLASRGVHQDLHDLELVDEAFGFKIQLRPAQPCRLFHHPVETISQSESGYERTYQGSALFLAFPLELGPGQSFATAVDLDFKEL